jgi:hypothetical protein
MNADKKHQSSDSKTNSESQLRHGGFAAVHYLRLSAFICG